jgi:ankyrin repeat protein
MARSALLCYPPPIKSETGDGVSRKLAAALAAMATLMMAAPASAQQYSSGYTFLKAVKDRNGAKVTDLVATPGSATLVNTKEPGSGNGALHIVARERDLTWLSFMIAKGARVDMQNASGDTPLGIAAQLGWAEGAQLLLSQRASVDLANMKGETPLIFAVQRRDLPMVRMLLSRGANPKRTDSVAGYSAIDYARQDQRSTAILKLLEAPPAAKPIKEAAGPKL